MDRLDSTLFDWQAWRGGTPADLIDGPCRASFLIAARGPLRKWAIGWCEGSSTLARPKSGHKGIMYQRGDHTFWFHLRDSEARAIYPEIFNA
jgi:hypothetical protein